MAGLDVSAVSELVERLTGELFIIGQVRDQMRADPERAAAVLTYALGAPRIRNRAGYAVAAWRSGFDPRPAQPPPAAELGPPSLAALEHAWSLEPSPVIHVWLQAMAVAIARAGGFKNLQQTLQEISPSR